MTDQTDQVEANDVVDVRKAGSEAAAPADPQAGAQPASAALPAGDEEDPAPPFHPWAAAIVGVWLALVTISSIWFGATVFNQLNKLGADSASGNFDAPLFWGVSITAEDVSRQMFVIALAAAAGVVGGLVYTSRSMAQHCGVRDFAASWIPWYVVRILVAGLLGVLVVMTLAAGLITGGSNAEEIEPTGVVAIAFIVGLASKKALEKFKDLIDVIFGSPDDEQETVEEKAERIAKLRLMVKEGSLDESDLPDLIKKIKNGS